MTTFDNPVSAASADMVGADAVRAAQSVATLLPASSELVVGVAQPPTLVDGSAWPGAASAQLSGGREGTITVLVGAELVTALASSPMGPLELGAAVQPALDAAAAALGTSAGAGRALDGHETANAIQNATVAVPLLADGATAAVLLVSGPSSTTSPVSSPADAHGSVHPPGLELLHGIAMDVAVELGRTRLSVRELLALGPGDVLELDRAAGSPADLLVNGRLIARGEVVVVDDNYALRITEIVSNADVN